MSRPPGAMSSPFSSNPEFGDLNTEQPGMPRHTDKPVSEQRILLAQEKAAAEKAAAELKIQAEVEKRLVETEVTHNIGAAAPTGVNVFSGPDLVTVITRLTALKLEPTSASPLNIETQIGGVTVIITKA